MNEIQKKKLLDPYADVGLCEGLFQHIGCEAGGKPIHNNNYLKLCKDCLDEYRSDPEAYK